jgi:1,4-dihydroxy-2-naphthoate octaprenyltransferase
MNMENVKKERSKLSIWLQAVRAFSFTASSIPVLLGAALALNYPGKVMWILLPVVYIAGLLIHAATNLISDYYDYKKDVDKDYTFGGSGVLVQGLLPAKSILTGGLVLFAITAALGIILIAVRGVPILVLGLIGIVGGYFYTGRPFGYKYFGLGDFLVFILMGPLMVIGSYYCLTGSYHHAVLLASLPVGFLVSAILQANNTRDIKHDTEAGIRTLENTLGPKGAKAFYYFALIAAYISVVLMVIFKTLPPWSLMVIATLPQALKNIIKLAHSQPDQPEQVATLDVETAQLHFGFGLLLTISLVLHRFIH